MRKLALSIIMIMSGYIISAAPVPQVPIGPGGQPLPPELQMSEEEFKQMVEFLNTLDEKELEELEKIGRQVLTDMGINPDTLEPVSTTVQPTTPVQEPKKPEEMAKSPINKQTAAELNALIKKLLNQMYHVQEQLVFEYRLPVGVPLRDEIHDIVYYLKMLDTPHLINELAQVKSEKLVAILRQLSDNLEKQSALLNHVIQAPHADNPYQILDVSSSATSEEIQKAFEEKAAPLQPEKLKESLQASQVPEKDVKRILKDAQLTLSLLKDAYETLIDPMSRERIDKEHKAFESHKIEHDLQLKASYEKIATIMRHAIYEQRLINAFENFLQEYAPEQLRLKKLHDEQEAASRKKQEELLKKQPSRSPILSQEKPIHYGETTPSRPSFIPSVGKDITIPSQAGKVSDESKKTPEGKKPSGGKKEGKKEEKKDKEKEKKESDKIKKESKKEEKKKKPSKKTAPELIKDISKPTQLLAQTITLHESRLQELIKFTHTEVPKEEPVDISKFTAILNAITSEGKPAELRSKLKELRDVIKEKKLIDMKPEDVAAWKNYYEAYNKLLESTAQIFEQISAPTFDGNSLNKDRLMLFMPIGEPEGALGIIHDDMHKISRYIGQINKVIAPPAKIEEKK